MQKSKTNKSKIHSRRLVGLLGGASLAAHSFAAFAQTTTLSGAQTSTQSLTGTDLDVATDATFSVTTPTGRAIDLIGTNGLTFTDNYRSVINGVAQGIHAENRGAGALRITSTGTVTATGLRSSGILAFNYFTGTNLTVTANTVLWPQTLALAR